MQDIQKLDTHFWTETTLSKKDVKVYDVCRAPFRVHGLMIPNEEADYFHRMPLDAAKAVSEAVASLQGCTAGGRVRFRTNSSYLAIHAELDFVSKMRHMPLAGSAGFDLYAAIDGKEIYLQSFIPPQSIDEDKIFEMEYNLLTVKTYKSQSDKAEERESNVFDQMTEYTLNFPLYSYVKRLYILLDENAKVEAPKEYRYEKPVVFYGSSITQGACASRPGNCYPSILSRRLGFDYVNLGFSGNARGELAMAEYIADLPMQVFVLDYDYNAPSVEYLKDTYEPFFQAIRQKQLKLPIICVSRLFGRTRSDLERRDFIKASVEKWRGNGDSNVYFVDGYRFREAFHAGDSMVVDGCHPGDLGFWCMAEVIGEALEKVFS